MGLIKVIPLGIVVGGVVGYLTAKALRSLTELTPQEEASQLHIRISIPLSELRKQSRRVSILEP
jgi:hypothetical protein